ncbi:hypothetical protein [Niabella hibiscisoli]|uniref:hypothetical protein n=1 Tax=Niabella hibiscisoli TaxID=1825928 RepID=UPI001F0CFBE4|nr:hypothetical protein [Niabella hibiscisoli]MCH5715919.1 hypothetical protein [Niabella hibiscisoli]
MKPIQEDSPKDTAPATLSVSEALKPAEADIDKQGSSFGASLKEGVLNYVEGRWGMPVRPYSAELMQQFFTERGISARVQSELLELIAAIDMNIYSGEKRRQTGNTSCIKPKAFYSNFKHRFSQRLLQDTLF